MHRLSFLLLAVPLLLSSCYRTEIEEAAPQLVVEGWIENGRPPVVQLTTTVPITTSKHSVDSLDRYVLKWARVTVSDGTKEVILTGVYNRRYTPPYLYTTGDMLGETGRTYTLKVDYAQFHAQAETTVPATVGLSGIQARPLEDGSRRYTIKASVQDDPQTEDYYKVFVRTSEKDMTMRSAYFGVFSDRTFNAGNTITINNGRNNLLHPAPDIYFSEDDRVLVKFCHVDSTGYRYWKAFEDYNAEGRNPLFNTMQNLPGNVRGGLGCWLGYGAAYYVVQAGRK